MDITIFKVFIRFLGLTVVSASSFLHSFSISSSVVGIYNLDENMSSSVIDTVYKYDVVVEENPKIPKGIEKVTKGQDGIYYLDANGKVFKTIQEKKNEVHVIGTGKEGNYTGLLTAYGPDCDTCDGIGVVACPNERGHFHNLIKEGIYYNDKEYGQVRIVAADHREFPCGTIVKIKNPDMDEFTAVVIDTGYAMRKSYEGGLIHMDLAYSTERGLNRFPTSYQTKFSVQRWGW